MARMIPSHIERDDPRRMGEYMVYDWFSDDSIPGVAFYSHPQNNHETKTMSEVDFLYICQNGILCIEVKGGKIHKKETQWRTTNKKGEVYKIQDPFWQAHGCMKAIASTLEETYGKKSMESRFCVGCAVIFPECIADCEGDGVIKEIMFDGSRELSDFGIFLTQSLKHWSDELYSKQSKRTIQLSEKQVNQMITLFEADFCAVPSMKLQIDTSYAEMLRLTEEQYDVLHSIDENKRALVYGAAGTGKSLLAVEKLKQNMCRGKNVAYICFNKNMASYVAQNIELSEGSFVGTYHAFMGKYISDAHEMNLEELNDKFISQDVKPEEKYDLLIIDEGQDILAVSTLKCLDRFVVNEMSLGEWIFFVDPNQDIFMKGKNFAEAEAFLKDKFSPCVLRLYKNCRNTAQIARRNSMLTSTPPTKYMNLSGPEVRAIEYTSGKDFLQRISKEISSLLAGGTPVRDIVVLSTKRLENSLLQDVELLADIEVREVRSFKGIKRNQINYMTVQSFKGLESKVVFYIDIDGFDDVENRRMNYVAMSRAQILLCYFYPAELKMEYEKRLLEGMEILE